MTNQILTSDSIGLANGPAPITSPVFLGDPQAPTPLNTDNDTSIATTAFVKSQGQSSGIYTLPSYVENGDGSITLGSGVYQLRNNADGQGLPSRYTIAGAVYTPADGVISYLVADYNAGTPIIYLTTNVALINETSVIPVITFFRHGTELSLLHWDTLGTALSNKIHQSIVKTQRYRRQDGLALGEAATRNVTVTSGTIWYGATSVLINAYTSASSPLRLYSHVAGVWTETTITQYNNSQYDNGTALASLTANRYAVNYIYRAIDVNAQRVYVVLGTGDYKLGDAQAAMPPSSLPPEIVNTAVIVGRIIVQQGTSTATQIDSAFAQTFTASPATNHNDLAGLQGGTASEYYHHTNAGYTIATTVATDSLPGYLSAADHATFNAKESALTFSTGLSRSINTITNDLATGISGGQTAYGGTLTTQGLTLRANAADTTTGTVTVTGATLATAALLNSTNTVDATSPTSNSAIKTAGGASIAKSAWLGGLLNVAGTAYFAGTVGCADTTDSTSPTSSSSLVVSGGASIAKALWVGGLANIAGTMRVTGATTIVGSLNAGNTTALSLNSTDTNSVVILNANGGASNNCQVDFRVLGATKYKIGTNLALGSSAAWEVYDSANAKSLLQIASNTGNVTFIGTVSMGALTATTGSFTSSTASTTTATGALVVTGGLGVGGAVNIGGIVYATGASISSSIGAAVINSTGGASSNSQVEFQVLGGSKYKIGTNLALGSSAAWEVYDSANAKSLLRVLANTGDTTVVSTTASTSTTTGSLIAGGGLGVAGAGYIGGLFNVAGVTTHQDMTVVPKTSGKGIQVDIATPTWPWRDLLGDMRPDSQGVNAPTLSAFRGGLVRQLFYSATDKMDTEFHIPHDYVPGTDIFAHVHWSHNGTAISGNFVVTLTYTYAKGHNQASFPAEKSTTITYATVNIATTPQYQHRIDEVAISSNGGSASLIDSSTLEVDGVVLMNLTVTTIPAITGGTTNEPVILYVDLHYQSTNIGTKQKSPAFWT